MKAKVDPDICIGCGLCAETCSDVFEMDGEIAIVKATPVSADAEDCARTATDECPVTAIELE